MKRLVYRKFKGLEIRCLKCGKTIHNNVSPYKNCKHPIENTAYRTIVFYNGKRITKTLVSRSYEGAVKELIDYRTDILNGIIPNSPVHIKPQLLIDCMAMYLDYLADIDTPNHQKKHNSDGYLNSINSFFNKYKEFIKGKGIDINTLKITDINDHLIGEYYSFLLNRTTSAYTFNHHVKAMRSVYSFLIEKKGYQIRNPFKEIKLKTEKGTNNSISTKDFYALLDIIKPEGAIQKIGKTTIRNMYKYWLKDAIKLKAFTGRRNEEIFVMSWDMINYENGEPIYIKSPNIKLNKLKNNLHQQEYEYTYIPVIKELEDLLIDIGLNENKGSKNYIIAPEILGRQNMEKVASKSFTFFFKRLNRNYKIQMKQLRSTYITASEIYSYRQVFKLQQHTNYRTTAKHYNNQKEIAKFISKDRSEHRFTVFE
uniref:phage integrase SAM-like domain-containing protein n=1 Tax=uncultured Draconibacterium sp. TaxID=1573823 RepID=UPI003216EB07